MGTVPQAETTRDKNLIVDYLLKDESGWVYSISQLGLKYARTEGDLTFPLTPTRIHQILNKHGVPKKRVLPRKKVAAKRKKKSARL